MDYSESLITARIDGSLRALGGLRTQVGHIDLACRTLRSVLHGGGRVLTCGNGGSAAQAMHLAEELIGKYRAVRPPFPATCLNADPTALTCIANDFGFDEVFARQVAALARPGDALVAFSTSGMSANILKALDAARAARAKTVGLLGRGGGPALKLCDAPVVVESEDTAHIQEAHQVLLHLILEAVEAG